MLAAQSPPSAHPIHLPKSGRKPLQPNNTPTLKPKPKIVVLADDRNNHNNKENIPPPGYATPPRKTKTKITDSILDIDGSLADELSAVRQKLERLRLDKEKTEKMLDERALMLDLRMNELLSKGEAQKQLEIEVDRLFRLNEIRLSCLRRSPLRTLRDKEHEKKLKKDQQVQGNTKTEEYKVVQEQPESTSQDQNKGQDIKD